MQCIYLHTGMVGALRLRECNVTFSMLNLIFSRHGAQEDGDDDEDCEDEVK